MFFAVAQRPAALPSSFLSRPLSASACAICTFPHHRYLLVAISGPSPLQDILVPPQRLTTPSGTALAALATGYAEREIHHHPQKIMR